VRFGYVVLVGSPAWGGSAILNRGRLSIVRTSLSNNESFGGNGGGTESHGALLVSDSILFGNTATNGAGGGIYNLGPAIIARSSPIDNLAGRWGGGVHNKDSAQQLPATFKTVKSEQGGVTSEDPHVTRLTPHV